MSVLADLGVTAVTDGLTYLYLGLATGIAALVLKGLDRLARKYRVPFGPRTHPLPYLALVGLALTVSFVITAAGFRFDLFLGSSILFWNLFFLAPGTLLGFFILTRRPHYLLAVAALVGLYWYTAWYEPFNLQVERVTIATEKLTRPVRVALFADLQCPEFGDYQRRTFAVLRAEAPELILFLGDFVQPPAEKMAEVRAGWREAVATLQPSLGMFAVRGNVDVYPEFTIEGLGFPVLAASDTWLTGDFGTIYLAGYDRNAGWPPAAGPESAFRLAMAHWPDAVRHFSGQPVDLMVCGHTHGGQVRLPWLGPVFKLTGLSRPHVGTFSKYEGIPLYNNRGLGYECGRSPRVRFNCPPELTILTLQPQG